MTTYADFLEFFLGVQASVNLLDDQVTLYQPAAGRFGRVNIAIMLNNPDPTVPDLIKAEVLIDSTTIYQSGGFIDALLTDIKIPAGSFLQVISTGPEEVFFSVTGSEFNEVIDW